MTWNDLYERCYTPYSDKREVCVVESKDGYLFPGVRIENVSYPDTISAVKAAICGCLSEGKSPQTVYIPESGSYVPEIFTKELSISVEITATLPEGNYPSVLKKDVQSPRQILPKLLDKAVVTESDFPVSCLIKTSKGYIDGVNVEFSDWSLGLCAERVAIAKAISHGINDFESMFVHTRYGEFSSPCGACRQVLMEHMPDRSIVLMHADGSRSDHQIQDLLPFHFSAQQLTDHTRKSDLS